MSQIPFFVSIPHSGEKVPEQCHWLKALPETILMSDVDRYVDQLYAPALSSLKIPFIKTEWHRYAVDLNRIPSDIDQSSVASAKEAAGKFSRGFHWVKTFQNDVLMPGPMSHELHQQLKELIYDPFHQEVVRQYESYKKNGFRTVYHIDAHSMPSKGTAEHRDPGELRADIVISDCYGKSCHLKYRDLVVAAYVQAGFKVRLNWPYFGGRLTEQYGKPQLGQQVIQVELNRGLYMNEQTKRMNSDVSHIQEKIKSALNYIKQNLEP